MIQQQFTVLWWQSFWKLSWTNKLQCQWSILGIIQPCCVTPFPCCFNNKLPLIAMEAVGVTLHPSIQEPFSTILCYPPMQKHISIWASMLICDWIWGKLLSMHTMARHTFHHHMILSCTHKLTIQASIDVESCPGCICYGLFLRLIRCPQVLEWSSDGSTSLEQADGQL